MEENVKKRKRFYQKWWFWTIIVIILIIGITGNDNDDEISNTNTATIEETTEDVADNTVEIIESNADAQTSEEIVEEAISISATDLYNAYDENEVSADNEYKDKLLDVSGIVDSVNVTLGQIQLKLTDDQLYSFVTIYCYFDDDYSDAVAELKTGDAIIVQGVCSGKSIYPSLTDCEIIE